jgi:hypothetical protein
MLAPATFATVVRVAFVAICLLVVVVLPFACSVATWFMVTPVRKCTPQEACRWIARMAGFQNRNTGANPTTDAFTDTSANTGTNPTTDAFADSFIVTSK